MALIDEQQEMVQGKHKTVLQQESKQRTLHQHQYSTFSILRQTVELSHGFLFPDKSMMTMMTVAFLQFLPQEVENKGKSKYRM